MQRLLIFFCACLALPSRADTVLVLPFFNESSSSNLDWIGESVSHTVAEALASRGMLVLDREDREEVYRRLSIRPYAHLTQASVMKVAEALDASVVAYGEFEVSLAPGVPASKASVRMTARILDMERRRKGPELLESGSLEELAQLQTHLAWQVLRSLAPDSTPSAAQFLQERPQVRLDAMENYTRGLLAQSAEQKHRYFTQAVLLDDGFSQPKFELGRQHWEKKEYRLAASWLSRVKPGRPRYFEANFLLGLCLYNVADYQGAQAAFARVAESVPLNEVFNNLGAAQSQLNSPAAAENFRKALEGDPADPDYHFNLGYALWKRGEFSAAAESFREVLARNPDDAQATTMLGRSLAGTGPRPAELKGGGLERVKVNYEEGAYRQLKAALEAKPPK